ncbi:MAG: fructose-6-phosphate aldolase [Verrucomicrobia bacterium]|nr:fructose-6-phosphate aldolase [Verrucomicrobiota bacterium]
MEIWLDTANLEWIKQAAAMGILHGVTTNPSIAAKSSLPLEELLDQILDLQEGPVTAQVTGETAPEMVKQAEILHSHSSRIMVKVPVTAEGLKAMHALSKKQIPVMATAVFDVNQALLAARAGAAYIAPYYSRICEEDMNGIEVLKTMLKFLNRYGLNAKLIAASIRSPEQVRECAEMGTHAITVNERVFEKLVEAHPWTVEALNRFAKDWSQRKKSSELF